MSKAFKRIKMYSVREFTEMKSFKKFLTVDRLAALFSAAVPRINSRGEAVASNGLLDSGAIWFRGKRIYVYPAQFKRWLASQNNP